LRPLAFAFAGAAAFVSAVAAASVSLPVTWDALVRGSTAAAIVTPSDARAVWEGGRICTYTHLHVDRAVAGDLATGDDAWVRTLGGVVGKIGQVVDGEASFAPGRPSLLFLRRDAVGVLDVTARGQGQFPVVEGSDAARTPTVVQSHAVGMLVPPATPAPGVTRPLLASEKLHGHPVDDALRAVAAAWTPAHAP
jgi:hypothetical protein